jgi:hypothetical protein
MKAADVYANAINMKQSPASRIFGLKEKSPHRLWLQGNRCILPDIFQWDKTPASSAAVRP